MYQVAGFGRGDGRHALGWSQAESGVIIAYLIGVY